MFNFFKTGYQKIKKALTKTSSVLGKKLRSVFSKPLNDKTLGELEKTLYEADIGSKTIKDFL